VSVRFWDYRTEYSGLRDEIRQAVDDVFGSGWLILGERVRAFEAAWAENCGVAFGVGVNSGTDALFLALKALGVGPGDEVVTVANTAIPTVSAIESTGARTRFVDIDPATFLMDPAKLEPVLNANTRCILPVHLYGQCADMEAINAIAVAKDIAVLEDCAQCHGATQQGSPAGSLGAAAAFSFYPTKVLGAYGDAGMVVSNDAGLANKVRRLRTYGIDDDNNAAEHGYNSRLDEIQAAILSVKLPHLPGWIAERQRLAGVYSKRLAGTALGLPAVADGNEHVYYAYVVRHPERERMIAALDAESIQVNISYAHPISLMPGYRHLGYGEGDLPESERACAEVFSLPLYPGLTPQDQDTVCHALEKALKEVK
jgi:aminotransferase EvaB